MNKSVLTSMLLTVVLSSSCFANTFHVNNEDDLKNRLAAAMPGDRIILAGGVYQMKNSLNVWRDGTEANPITCLLYTSDAADE